MTSPPGNVARCGAKVRGSGRSATRRENCRVKDGRNYAVSCEAFLTNESLSPESIISHKGADVNRIRHRLHHLRLMAASTL